MHKTLSKSSILKKTAQVAGSTIASKALAILRAMLEVQYLGVGQLADAFLTAFRIPNSLRKIFAEGALSAAFVPTIIKMSKEGQESQVNKLMTLTLLVVEGIVLLLCGVIFLNARGVMLFLAPGFAAKPETLIAAISLAQILIFFLLFVSMSALFAGTLQAKDHFFIPSWGPVILNIFYIAGLFCGIRFGLSLTFFSCFIILGGVVLLLLHLLAYFYLGYSFEWPNRRTWSYFGQIMLKFLPCIITGGIIELNLWIDNGFASFGQAGTIALFSYAYGFVRIPLQTFASALSTTLLPHFSRLSTYAPKRLSFYYFEASKLIFWVTFPATLLMMFFSTKLFQTFFLSSKFPMDYVVTAGNILTILVAGLFFYSLNKILLSMYYSFHSTMIPSIIAGVGTGAHYLLNLVLMPFAGIYGIAFASTCGTLIQTLLLSYALSRFFGVKMYHKQFSLFIGKYLVQLALVGVSFFFLYKGCICLIASFSTFYSNFFLNHLGFWMWIAPLVGLHVACLYVTRKWFGLKMYFLD